MVSYVDFELQDISGHSAKKFVLNLVPNLLAFDNTGNINENGNVSNIQSSCNYSDISVEIQIDTTEFDKDR